MTSETKPLYNIGDTLHFYDDPKMTDFIVIAILKRETVKTIVSNTIKGGGEAGTKLHAEFDGWEYYINQIGTIFEDRYGPIKEEELKHCVEYCEKAKQHD